MILYTRVGVDKRLCESFDIMYNIDENNDRKSDHNGDHYLLS